MKTYQNFEEIQRKDIIICPGLMVLTRTQCTQFTSPPSWRGRQLFRWLNCVLFSLINDYTLFIFLPQITSEVENKILMIYQTLSYSWLSSSKEMPKNIFLSLFSGEAWVPGKTGGRKWGDCKILTLCIQRNIFFFFSTSRPRTSPISWQKIWITYCFFIIAVIVEGRVKTGLECTKR